jgi:hypothetical protein
MRFVVCGVRYLVLPQTPDRIPNTISFRKLKLRESSVESVLV